MGLYATLDAPVQCPSCGIPTFAGWQFHFGDVSALPRYRLGDTVTWGGADRGDRTMLDVIAVGYLERDWFCVACKIEHALANIHIVEYVIRSITFRSTEPWISETLFEPERDPG